MPNSHEPHAPKMFRLNLLGGAVLGDAGGAPVAQQRRRIALLALVAAAGDPGMTRDRLMALLSPDSPVDSARHALHQLLYYLRQLAGEDLFLGTDPIRLNPAVVTSDVREFDAAYDKGAWAAAAVLYRGPFLDGFHLGDSREFEEWSAAERSRLTGRFAEALFRLARESDAAGDSDAAIEWWRRLTLHDPLDGRAALGLITALAAGRDTPGAVRHARAHGALVRSELGREPDPEIAAFLATLRQPAEQREPQVSSDDLMEAATAAPSGPGRSLRVVPVLVVAVLLGLAGWLWLRPRQPAENAIGRLAVLPLVNGSRDTTVASITAALTQELISRLSGAGLRVIGYYSVDKYRDARPPVAEIGRELGVDAVATWTVLRDGGQWRVALEVSRASTGEGLWSSTRYVLDSLRLGDVAEGTAKELSFRFGARDAPSSPRPRLMSTGAPEAKLAYLRGMDRRPTQPGSGYSVEQFARAIEIDSTFAPGHAGLGEALTWSIDYGALPVREACRRARPAVARALELDPRLALGHLANARVKLHCDWDWEAADAAFRRALAFEPSAMSYHYYGWFLSWYLGRFREGIAFADTALALEPLSAHQHMAMAWRLLAAGDLDQAENEARAALTLDSRILDGPWILAEVHLMRGDLETAEREALSLRALPTANPPNWSMLGEIYARTGRFAEARAYLALLAESTPLTGAAQIAIARTQLALGERDAVLTMLERAVEQGVFIIPFQPYWNPVRSHPRFQALMKRMGL